MTTQPTSMSRQRNTRGRMLWLAFAVSALAAVGPVWSPTTAQAPGPCEAPNGNEITCENALPGNFPSEWDVAGAGATSIQGYATDISVNKGQTVNFKIDTSASAYRLDIYRMGYYGGRGARQITTVLPSATLPQIQPDCLTVQTTGLVDCGNWAVSASWTVPSTAVSGIYFAKVIRLDTLDASHIVWVVRDDAGASDLLFQTSDTTWQAYNEYGGNSFYAGGPGTNPGRAYKVSYNRPFTTRSDAPEDWVFNAEYPMVRFLEANGYDVSYTTGIDSDRRGTELLEHKAFLSVGHDEYWSGAQRTAVENARAAGVHLGFFSGNEVFWKVRYESSVAPSGAAYRTLVSYKETHANAKIDPTSSWTGTWRDPRFTPSSDGGRPENALTGTSFVANCCTYAITVPAAEGKHRFWRGTEIAALNPGGIATLPDGTLGYEWDEDADNGFRPAGLQRLSDTNVSIPSKLQDYGSTYASGTARHNLTLYKHASGALVFGAGTVQWSWGLDGEHDRGASTTSLAMQQATVNLFADMGTQPMSIQPGLNAAVPSNDTLGPDSIVMSPANGATVPMTSVVTISGTATDSGGGLVAGVEVSVDGGATWRRAKGRESWSYSWQTGGAGSAAIVSRAADDSGNVGATSNVVTVTVANVPASCPCSLWTPSQEPSLITDRDNAAVELGLKFRASSAGYISGVRFYKGPQNVGPHIGSLWTTTGTLLARATFSNETSSGWQQVDFATAVAIDANTTYVVSYHTASGHQSQDSGYFANDYQNGPLTAPASSSTPNGVFRYGSAPGFPAREASASNFWVDVVFVTAAGPDTTAPAIVNRSPAPNASAVSATSNVRVAFSERLSPSTVTTSTLQLRGPGNVSVPAAVTWDAGTLTATLDPSATLAHSTQYTVTLLGGAAGVKDLAGNAIASTATWTYMTAAAPPPPPTEGPGGPVLVITTESNQFTKYYAEILRAEGLNSFAVADIGTISAGVLANYDVVVLGEVPLSTTQAAMFSTWVTGGGNLIAMRPDSNLASLLGLTGAGTTLAEGYIAIDTALETGAGLVSQTMQYHGAADRYTLSGATAVATLYSTATTATANPAVTIRNVGSNGGTAVAFTFDLARSVVYTRQGNPAWAGQDRDGLAPVRSDDLFFGGSDASYVDFDKIAIPQADEQQRLFVRLISVANRDKKPLPRFWYFPNRHKAVVVMTGDDHARNGTAPMFDWFANASPVNCSLIDWQCVRASSYLYPSTPLADSAAAAYVAAGFEIAVHVSTSCGDYTPSTLPGIFQSEIASFTAAFPSLPAVKTNRTHCIVWSDYTTQAEVSLVNGIRMDTNYYYWPDTWVNDRPGVFTGSGMPMRFAKTDGTMIDVYQAPTQMTDEAAQSYPLHADVLLDRALGAEGYYGAFVANMHTDYDRHPDSEAIVLSAQARGVPVISADQLLTWVDGRNASSFQNMTWNGGRLEFTVAVGAGAHGLHAMLPLASTAGPLASLTVNGTPVSYTTETIKGVVYVIFPAAAGSYQADYAPDTTAPVISAVAATATSTGATVTWTTSELSSSVVHYGTTSGTLNQTASAPGLVLTHTVTLSGLSEGTRYYYRVTSADPSGNTASAPTTAPLTFNTVMPAITDTTVADFSAGTPDAAVVVTSRADGELSLRPAIQTDFSGTSLPGGWTATPWTSGGGATVADGNVTVNGALLVTDQTYSGPRSLEFVATFGSVSNQHAGFGLTLNESLWAIFSTGNGGTLSARTHTGTLATNTTLGASWLGAPHRYRIDWTNDSVTFSIDGTVVAAHFVTIGANMRPVVSDLSTGDAPVVVDYLHILPYAPRGVFTSRVLDGQSSRAWNTLSWSATTPAGTGLDMEIRFGNVQTPDGSWSPFVSVPTSGATVSGTSRYVQYRAVLTGDGGQTPQLASVTLTGAPAPEPGPGTGVDPTPVLPGGENPTSPSDPPAEPESPTPEPDAPAAPVDVATPAATGSRIASRRPTSTSAPTGSVAVRLAVRRTTQDLPLSKRRDGIEQTGPVSGPIANAVSRTNPNNRAISRDASDDTSFGNASATADVTPTSSALDRSTRDVSADIDVETPANTAPTIQIGTPTSYVIVRVGTPVILAATATDAQDGSLTSTIVWTSSLQGRVSSGGTTHVTLAPGSHRVSATVTDAQGVSASAAVVVVVRD